MTMEVAQAMLCADAGSGKAIKVLAAEVRRLQLELKQQRKRIETYEECLVCCESSTGWIARANGVEVGVKKWREAKRVWKQEDEERGQ